MIPVVGGRGQTAESVRAEARNAYRAYEAVMRARFTGPEAGTAPAAGGAGDAAAAWARMPPAPPACTARCCTCRSVFWIETR